MSLGGRETLIINANGRFLSPGFIDTHLHLHHTILTFPEYCKEAIKSGVLGVCMDFYAEGVVRGIEAIRKQLDSTKNYPMRVFYMLPFAGYIQNLPWSQNGNLTIKDMYKILEWDECYGSQDTFAVEIIRENNEEVLELCKNIQRKGKFISGHGSELSNMQINKWVRLIRELDDHECIDKDEMLYKLRHGIAVTMRYGTGTDNLYDLCQLFKTHKEIDKRRIALNSDTLMPMDLFVNGYMDRAIRDVIKNGVSLLEAYQMATINAADILKISSHHGSITPGRKADILFIDDLEKVSISSQRIVLISKISSRQ